MYIDSQYTLAAFKNACKYVGGLKGIPYNSLIKALKEAEPAAMAESPYQFKSETLYRVFMSNEQCKAICEKNKYTSWEQIAYHSYEITHR